MNLLTLRFDQRTRSAVFTALAVWALMPCVLLASCSAPPRGPAVPAKLAGQATVLNDPALRSWGDTLNPEFMAEVMKSAPREAAARKAEGLPAALPPAYFLGLSGGGANGAYGAGLLCGWTKTGTRPEFKLVTGISTGALTAPFAFLGGAKYDEKLSKVYRTVTTNQICTSRGMLAALFDDALASTKPLRELMKTLVDEEMMRDIATQYGRGRLLLVATTNLDSCRSVVWNVGAIAASGHKDSLEVIHDILIASAAIPAAFPPVMIDVMADGKPYQEMHVDGGAMAQVFLYPPSLQLSVETAAAGIERERVAYIIRNARLDPAWAAVERLTLPIAGRAIGSLIDTQGIGDLYRIYVTTQRDHVAYNLAYIPDDFTEVPAQAFDPVYMCKLYDVAFAAVTKPGGYAWSKSPPGFTEKEGAVAEAQGELLKHKAHPTK